ncbi:MAG: response regulator transcription factor [Saprospiraceae bacterium]|nr:response regulator transcription factor [Saprospiraceae bacterium]
MSAIGYTPIKPISEYVALKAEIAYWKQQFFDLHSKTEANSTSSPSSLYIKDNGITRQVLLTQIIMLEADSNYTRIVLVSGENILTCKTLKSWMEKIGANTYFVRPHRSFLVNKNHIMSYQSKPRKMILTGSKEVPLARSFKVNDLNDPNNE